jgi:cyclopropane fatty-acyl-phospholipid synthase-like methyltransferase
LRGNTAPNVNSTIIKYLLAKEINLDNKNVLDIPCGDGIFLDVLKHFYPNCQTFGAEISVPSQQNSTHQFIKINAQKDKIVFEKSEKLSLITCISGVMEFDNTLHFFEQIKLNLDEKGLFIVTNDNLQTVRDRIFYMLFGRFGQYKLFIENQPTWKIIPLQNLLRILNESGFEIVEIQYVPIKFAHWLWLPIAVIIYFFQLFYLYFAEKNIPFREKLKRYPFLSLLSRHYILVCRQRA